MIIHLEEFSQQLSEGLETLDWNNKREMIRALVKRMEVGKEDVRVVYKVGQLPFVQDHVRGTSLQHCLRVDRSSASEHRSERPGPVPGEPGFLVCALRRRLHRNVPRERTEAEKVLSDICPLLAGMRQELSLEKTVVRSFQEGFDFLASRVTRWSIKMQPKKVEAFKEKIWILTYRSHKLDATVIRKLNAVIRETANYIARKWTACGDR